MVVDQIVLGLGIYICQKGFFSGSLFRGAYFWIGSLHLLEIHVDCISKWIELDNEMNLEQLERLMAKSKVL